MSDKYRVRQVARMFLLERQIAGEYWKIVIACYSWESAERLAKQHDCEII